MATQFLRIEIPRTNSIISKEEKRFQTFCPKCGVSIELKYYDILYSKGGWIKCNKVSEKCWKCHNIFTTDVK
jgi:hypothetical protein